MPKNQACVRQAWKLAIKETIWTLTSHRPGAERDICVFSTRRGGSTWLMEALSAAPGIRYVDQPLSLMSDTVTAAQLLYLPRQEKGQITALDADEEARVGAYMDGLFDGSLTVNAPFRFWRSSFHFRTDRTLLKIVDGKPLIDWIDQRYQPHVIYQVRHPIPQALSCIRNRAPNRMILTTEAYLGSDWVRRHLTRTQLQHAQSVARSSSLLDRYVLNWGVENLVPLRLLPQRPHWITVSYEALVHRPDSEFSRIAGQLALAASDRILHSSARPSKSTRTLSTAETRRMIETGNRDYLTDGWRDKVSEEEETRALDILSGIGITLYRPGTSEPDWPDRGVDRSTSVPEDAQDDRPASGSAPKPPQAARPSPVSAAS